MASDTERHARRARERVARRRRRLLAVGCLGVAVATVGIARLTVSKGGAAHRLTAPASSAAHRRADAPSLPGPFHGYLLIADRGNNRMLLVDGAHRVLWMYPKRTPGMPFRFDDDTFFGPTPNRIISNQEDQHTIQVISFPAGRVLWRYGHTNLRGGAPGFLNTPDDAYLLRDGLVSVADAYNCRVLFIAPSHRIVRQFGTTGVCRHDPPSYLGAVNGATPLPDGGTLVSEITGSWIDDIGPAGRLRWAVQAPVSYPSDPQPLPHGRILLADYARPGHVIVMSRRGNVLWRYGPASGPGELDHPSLAAAFSPGLIAVNDDFRHRVVFISLRTHRIVWQYGHTGIPGRAPGFLNTPDGMAFLSARQITADPMLRKLETRAAFRPRRLVLSRRSTRPSGSVVRVAPFSLPAPVEREVAVRSPAGVVIAGGLDSAQQSTNGVFLLEPRYGSLRRLGAVPEPFHDAAGALIDGRLFVFGGGASTSSSAVQSFDLRTHRSAVVGHLVRPLSDLVAAKIGAAVYLVGGYDGNVPRREIFRTYDGVHIELVGRLPLGLRYPAVAVADGELFIAGGVSVSGPVSAVYRFDPRTGRVSMIGSLPVASAHAAAVPVGSGVDVLGGSPAVSARIDPRTGRVEPMPLQLDEANGAVVSGRPGYILGGDVSGRIIGKVWRIQAPGP